MSFNVINSPAMDIKDLLHNESIGEFSAVSGWGIYLGLEPATPNSVITIYDTGGMSFDTICKTEIDDWTCQIRVRGSSYQSANQKMREIVDFLNLYQHYEYDLDDDYKMHYQIFYRVNLPQSIGYDNKKSLWTVNFEGLRQIIPIGD